MLSRLNPVTQPFAVPDNQSVKFTVCSRRERCGIPPPAIVHDTKPHRLRRRQAALRRVEQYHQLRSFTRHAPWDSLQRFRAAVPPEGRPYRGVLQSPIAPCRPKLGLPSQQWNRPEECVLLPSVKEPTWMNLRIRSTLDSHEELSKDVLGWNELVISSVCMLSGGNVTSDCKNRRPDDP